MLYGSEEPNVYSNVPGDGNQAPLGAQCFVSLLKELEKQ